MEWLILCHMYSNNISIRENTLLQDRIVNLFYITVIETAPKLLGDLENYEHRETILYCGTMALNGILAMGV